MSVLEISGISKAFGGLRALNDVSLAIAEGEIVSVIGPNGSGKTTFFNCISGFERPDEGRVVWSGRDVTGLPPHVINAAGISRSFQNSRLWWNMTVAETISIGYRRRRPARLFPDPEALLDFLHLAPYRTAFAADLPYGDQRRLDIARALATNPRLVLLDEPAAGMNEAESRTLAGMLQALRTRGCTIVMVDHDMSVVMSISDRIAVLNFGNKIAEGHPAEILRNALVVEAYLGEHESERRAGC